MTTIIRHIRAPFDTERENKLDTLFDHLAAEALDPTFERYGDFCQAPSAEWLDAIGAEALGLDRKCVLHFWGNFYNLSAVFDVVTDDEDVIVRLITAIRANKATIAYKEARDARQQQSDDRAVHERRMRKALRQPTRSRH